MLYHQSLEDLTKVISSLVLNGLDQAKHLSEEGSDHIIACQADSPAGGKSHIQTFCPHSWPSFLSIYIMQSPKSAAPRPRHVPALLTDDHTPCLLEVTKYRTQKRIYRNAIKKFSNKTLDKIFECHTPCSVQTFDTSGSCSNFCHILMEGSVKLLPLVLKPSLVA